MDAASAQSGFGQLVGGGVDASGDPGEAGSGEELEQGLGLVCGGDVGAFFDAPAAGHLADDELAVAEDLDLVVVVAGLQQPPERGEECEVFGGVAGAVFRLGCGGREISVEPS